MSEHTPQHENLIRSVDPDPKQHAGVDPTHVDLVAGDPPIPITVWRTARTESDRGRAVPARLAYRLVAAYSRPGEPVVDLTADHSLTAACAAGGRRHHRAWFTDASSIIIGPATPPAGQPCADRDGDDPLELSAWFGDDLTDPDLPSSNEAPVEVPDGAPVNGATSLVVACWPLDDVDAANRVRLAWLLTACTALLRPGGCLILVVGIPAGVTATPEDFSPVVTAAAQIGLGYLQHIVAVAADTEGDAFVYHVTDEELLTLAQQSGEQQWAVAHLRVHADLLVFSQHQPPNRPQRARRQGGGRRG